jgi:hypothetical protein
MNRQRPPSLARFNEAFGKALLALWPEEKKVWGLAFSRELPAIASPREQFLWLLGGIPVLVRERFRSFLQSLGRPMGVDAAGIEAPGRRPRTPRVVVALLFAIFAWLLWQPETRTVFRSVSAAYTPDGWNAARWPEVRRLEALARTSRDPQLAAFASLLSFDEAQRLSLADAAIRADASLAWIDYENAVLPSNDVSGRHLLASDRVDRLLAADPGNAALYLLRADAIASPYAPGAGGTSAWEALASRDARWLAAMEQAFRAPRYDPYDRKLFELSQTVMARYSVNEPRILVEVLGRRPLDQYPAIRAYTKVLLGRASDLERKSEPALAAGECSKVIEFARRLRAGTFFALETWIANDIESLAYAKLEPLYRSAGRPADAAGVAARSEENRSERTRIFEGNRAGAGRTLSGRTFPHWSATEWAGLAMEGSVLAIWILLPASLAGVIGLSIVRRRGRFFSLLAVASDLCPSFLVLACSVLFMSYAPYDETCWQVLRGPYSAASYRDFAAAAYAPFALPPEIRQAAGVFFGPHGVFLLWSAVTAVLTLAGGHLVFRQLVKRRGS